MRKRGFGWIEVVTIAAVLLRPGFAPAHGDEPGSPPASEPPVRPASRPLTLREAIVEALGSSPALRLSQDTATVAEIQRRVAASRFGLKLTPALSAGSEANGLAQRYLGVGISKRLPIGTELGLSVNSLSYDSGAGEHRDAGYTFTISQPMLKGFGPAATFELQNAGRALIGAERALTEARQQLVVGVAEAYFAVLKQRRLVEAAERALGRAGTLRRASEARASVGLATQLDVLRADLLASEAQATLAMQREALLGAEDQLKLLLGRTPDAPLEIAGGGDGEDLDQTMLELEPSGWALPEAEPQALVPAATGEPTPAAAPVDAGRAGERRDGADAAHLVALALASRAEVHESRDRIADARLAERVARWNLLPELTLNASYTRRGVGSPAGDLFNDLFGGWRVAVATSYAFDRAAELAQAETTRLVVQAAERAAAETTRRIATEVRRAYRAWLRAGESIGIQAKAFELAEKQLRLAELRYQRGLADNFDVVDAETNVFQAQTGLIAAQVERTFARLALARATGSLDPDRFLR